MIRRATNRRALSTYARVTVAVTFLLLIAGGLVTSTDSGLAVPDWPLSYGMWFPPMVGGILYEHGHRMIAAIVAMMILALAVWLWKAEGRRWVRVLGYSALAAVLIQAVLGGLTVLWLLPPQISIAHACLGQAVFCLVVCVAICTSPGWEDRPVRVDDRGVMPVRVLASALALLAALQLLLGAIIRHTGHAVFIHMGGAFVLLVLATWLVARLAKRRHRVPRVWGSACGLLALIGVQILLGLFVFMNRGSTVLRTAHVGIGALLLAQAVVTAWETLRRIAHPRSHLTTEARPAEVRT